MLKNRIALFKNNQNSLLSEISPLLTILSLVGRVKPRLEGMRPLFSFLSHFLIWNPVISYFQYTSNKLAYYDIPECWKYLEIGNISSFDHFITCWAIKASFGRYEASFQFSESFSDMESSDIIFSIHVK